MESLHPLPALPGDTGAGGSTGLQDDQDSLGSPGDSVIRELFCSEVENRSPCLCGIETVYSSLMLLFNMHYPDSQGERIKEHNFAEILKKSICLQQRSHTWCGNCDKYSTQVLSQASTSREKPTTAWRTHARP
ncbi:PAN2-PAN3 deadenylation complex catalytic subunit PAN2-like [Maylandia zebra]|uniref:PAN2-PAN3 deadenylation complex catalytic subunit PAN2-like n=1 Tax=Maylandia zebra TaxID=106582 RepID=UPI00403C5747